VHQPSEVWLSPTGSINLSFTTEGKLVAVLIIPSSWGSQRGVIYMPSSAVAGEKEDFCKGSLSLPIFYFVIVLLYFIFASIFLSKIQKKIKLVSLIDCIPLLLLLVHYVVP
jgi:hypothetical protein